MEYSMNTDADAIKTRPFDNVFYSTFSSYNSVLIVLFKTLVVTAFVFCSGCATVVGEPTQSMDFVSTPVNALLTITDETGTEVFNGSTPVSITLDKSDGTYFGGKTYRAVFDKQGFVTESVTITARPNGWYLAGNFIFGGLIGWLVVDPRFGDMYRLSPDSVDVSLATSLASYEPNRLHIVLLQHVPVELIKNLQPL